MRFIVKNLLWIAGIITLGGFIVLMGTLIFPGAMNWTASQVCPADQTTTIVVRDTYQTEPGETSTNFTLYCVGERGQFTDAGFAQPVLWLTIWFCAIVFVLSSLLRIWAWFRKRRAGPEPEDAMSVGATLGGSPPGTPATPTTSPPETPETPGMDIIS